MEMSAFMYLSLKCAHYYANSISLPSRANLCEHIPTDLGLVWGWLCPGVLFIVSVCWVLTPLRLAGLWVSLPGSGYVRLGAPVDGCAWSPRETQRDSMRRAESLRVVMWFPSHSLTACDHVTPVDDRQKTVLIKS